MSVIGIGIGIGITSAIEGNEEKYMAMVGCFQVIYTKDISLSSLQDFSPPRYRYIFVFSIYFAF